MSDPVQAPEGAQPQGGTPQGPPEGHPHGHSHGPPQGQAQGQAQRQHTMQIPIPIGPNGERPTDDEIRQIHAQILAEAAKLGIPPEEYVARLRQQAMAQQQAAMQAQMQQQQQQQQQPIQPGPPKPEAIALANWLKSQELKPRTVIHDEKRKDMFRVKRAIRALFSPAYQKARAKNPLLPEVTDRASAENTFKLLPLSLLALRVSKVDGDAHEGHNHAKPKRVKGLWTVKIEQHQEANDDQYYIWLYEGSQWKQKLYAIGALVAIMAIVLFPLWPLFMRQGVWYLSMGMLGLIGLFFAMAIVRLILFIITIFVAPPGLWLYPNLFEDVGFFDSFRPVWAWQETIEDVKNRKRAKKEKKAAKLASKNAAANGKHVKGKKGGAAEASPAQEAVPVDSAPQATGVEAVEEAGTTMHRPQHATVEEADDE